MLRLAAQLAPAPLSRLLVAQTLSTADKLDTIKAQDVADIAMSAVAAHSLARETSPGHLLVHTLVSRTMRFRDKDVGRLGMLYTCALPAVERLLGNDIFEARLHGNIGDLIAHARAVLAPAMADPVHATLAQARLLDAVYIYDAQHGNYASALLSANALVSYSRATAGPEHRVTLGFMLYRGRMQRLKGDLPDAWETNQRRVEICRRTLGKGHPDTLTALSDLALVLAQQGQLAQARELQEQVLAMRIHILGTEHEDTLTAANNLATTMATSGDFANARPLQEGVVAGRRKLLGPEHVETLAAISNLAVTLRALKDTAGAENLEHSLKASSSENLPENLLFLHNRAAALHGEGKLAEARELMERVLQLRRNQLGAKHPETLLTMNNLGSIMITQGDFAAARSLLQEGLQLSREVLGPNHIQTWQAAGRLFLASVHEGQGWEQVKASMLHDLAPLMAQDPATLSDELREHRNMALALRKIAGAEHPRSKP